MDEFTKALSSINSSELSTILIDPLSRIELQDALATDKLVIVHEKPIEISGWRGSGYIIIDPVTGSGHMKYLVALTEVFIKLFTL